VIGLIRVRLGLLAAAFVVLGATAGGIFDTNEWALIVTPTVPCAVVALLVRRSPWLRTLGAIAAVFAATAICVFSVGGNVDDIGVTVTSGTRRLLSTEWPSPTRGDLVGTVGTGLASMAALSALLATWRRWHLLPLLPVVITYVGVVALAAPRGLRPLVLVLLCAIAIPFATLRVDGSVRERWMLLRGERRLIGFVAIAGLLALGISFSVSFATRADPRREDPAQESAALLDPIEETTALRALEPPLELHEVTATGDSDGLPVRWRTAALEEYDGRRWTPVVTLRPIGRTLGPVTGPTVSAAISFLNDDLRLVPFPGNPVSVDAAVETDRERSVVRLAERPDPGDSVDIVSNVTPNLASIGPAVGIVSRPVDETVAGLTGFAESIGAGGEGGPDAPVLDQLITIEQTMRDDFVLDSDAPAGGLQRKLIDRFLRDTQRGNTEQFATAFVLLSRSLGVNARVATGFVVDAPATSPLTLSSADAVIWPEIELTDGTWVAFDPVPVEETTAPAPQEPQSQVQTPAAPQPPIAAPPESADESSDTDDATTDVETDALSTVVLWVTRAMAAVLVVLLPIVVGVGLVLGIKYRRRRRRRRASQPTDRIRGAWASATDELVDAGLDIPASFTDDEIARRGDPLAPNAHRELHRLAVLNSAATYGAPHRPDLLAQDALHCLDAVDTAIASTKSRWERVRWRLSLRSLRSTTRSPVAP